MVLLVLGGICWHQLTRNAQFEYIESVANAILKTLFNLKQSAAYDVGGKLLHNLGSLQLCLLFYVQWCTYVLLSFFCLFMYLSRSIESLKEVVISLRAFDAKSPQARNSEIPRKAFRGLNYPKFNLGS